VRHETTPSAFTLVELLVVVAILGLLVAILLPSLSGARTEARRVSCASNLKQIGIGIQSYLEANRDHLPLASFMPSLSPWPVEPPGGQTGQGGLGPGQPPPSDEPDEEDNGESGAVRGAIRLSDLLLENVGNRREVFQCPEDKPGATSRPDANAGRSYFESEGSSYEFRRFFGGLVFDRLAPTYERFTGDKVANNMLWIMRDYNNFHGPAGSPGSRRYLYVDGHVTDFEY
jgi:prepilin-type N-terminal cleavage/methylation domain-containing protein